MSQQAAYAPLAFTTLNGTVSITATASPGNTVIQANVPATTANALDVEITDIDVVNVNFYADGTPYLFFQMFVSGFGLSSPIYQNIGHTGEAGVVDVRGTQLAAPGVNGIVFGNIRWLLPNGAAGVNLSVGGTVGFAVYYFSSTALTANFPTVGASYMVVWGIYSSVV